MVNPRELTDPSRCPSCAAVLVSTTTCPTCGVLLRSATAAEVWRVSAEAAALLERRGELIRRMRTEATEARRASYGPVYSPPAGGTEPAAPAPSAPAGSGPPPTSGVAAAEWSRRRVQNLLLGLGVLLLAVAAVIFLVVSWGVLGVGGRAAVMAGCTAVAAGGATVAFRRGLGATAEAVALLTLGLCLLDAYGARSAGLGGLDEVDRWAYWAVAVALIAAGAGAGAAVLPLRSLRTGAAVLGQVPGPLLAVFWGDGSDHPAAVAAAVLTVQVVVTCALAVVWPLRGAADARGVVGIGGGLIWTCSVLTAGVASYGEDGSLVLGSALLLVLAAVAVGAALGYQPESPPAPGATGFPGSVDVLLGAASVVTVAALWAPAADADIVSPGWIPAALCALALAPLAAMLLVPSAQRASPTAVFLVAAVAPVVAVAESVGTALVGPLSRLDEAWEGRAASSAREALGIGLTWPGHVSTPLVPLLAAVAVVIGGTALPLLRRARTAAVPLLAVAALVTPAALDLSFRVGLGVDIAFALLLLGGGPEHLRRGEREERLFGWVVLGTGVAALGVAVAWSFAAASTTLVVLPLAALALAGAGWRLRPAPGASEVARSFAGGSVLLLIAEAAAAARHGGAGWPAVWTLSLTLAALAGAAGAVVARGARREALAAVATMLLAADTAAITVWAGGSGADASLAASVTGAVVVVLAGQPLVAWPSRERIRTVVAAAGGAAAAVGAVGTAPEPNRLWLALLAVGVAAGFMSLQGVQRRELGWLSGLLLAASSWVRLALSDVDAPEPYTVPAGIGLVVVGALRRRRDPAYRSWTAYAPGLGLALLPSLVRAVDDAGVARPLLLGLAALAVLAVGVARRLQAPLVLGGLVLAVDGLVQLSPYLAGLYAAVPRWTVIGAIGLLLLGLGATYERRVRDVRRISDRLTAYG